MARQACTLHSYQHDQLQAGAQKTAAPLRSLWDLLVNHRWGFREFQPSFSISIYIIPILLPHLITSSPLLLQRRTGSRMCSESSFFFLRLIKPLPLTCTGVLVSQMAITRRLKSRLPHSPTPIPLSIGVRTEVWTTWWLRSFFGLSVRIHFFSTRESVLKNFTNWSALLNYTTVWKPILSWYHLLALDRRSSVSISWIVRIP